MAGKTLRGSATKPRGLTLIEVAIMVSIIAIMSAVGIPMILGSIQRTGVDGASRRLADDVRLAQSHALTRGAQTRLIAFNQGGTAVVPNPALCTSITNVSDASKANMYRIELRTSPLAAWPGLGDTPGTNGNVLTAWIEPPRDYQGVVLTTGGTVFFNSQGFPLCSPVSIAIQSPAGARTVQVNSIGKATIQ